MSDDPKAHLMALLKKVRIGMMSTRGNDGHFHSRPMATSDVEFDGSLYFLTDDHSGKVHDLAKEPETLVTYADEGQQVYVALRGTGELIHDTAQVKAHWTAAARGWFPKGPEDPEIALIKVTIEDAEYWDAPNGKMVVLLAYAKAVITGKRPGNIGEHERVNL